MRLADLDELRQRVHAQAMHLAALVLSGDGGTLIRVQEVTEKAWRDWVCAVTLYHDAKQKRDRRNLEETKREVRELVQAAQQNQFCAACRGTGRNPMSDVINWTTCAECGGSGLYKGLSSSSTTDKPSGSS